MAVNTMKRLSLAAYKGDAERLVREIVWLSSVELIPLSEAGEGLLPVLKPGEAEELSEKERLLERVETALKMIAPYRSGKATFLPKILTRKEFEDFESEESEALDTVNKLSEILDITEKNTLRLTEAEKEKLSLSPWRDTDLPLNVSGSARAAVCFGYFPAGTDIGALEADTEAAVYAEEAFCGAENYAVVFYLRKNESAAAALLAEKGFTRLNFGTALTAKERIAALDAEIDELNAESERLKEAVKGYAPDAEKLERLYDFINYKISNIKARSKLFATENAVFLQGWIPEKLQPTVERTLSGFECFYELSDPTEEEADDVPVRLENGKFASAFEPLIALYSYPKYKTFDPLKIMSVFYFIIFGMMLQDAIYGLLLTFGCLWFLKKKNPRGTVKEMAGMFMICGISTTFFGVVFGGYMGDFPNKFAENFLGKDLGDISLWFSPIDNPMLMLIISLAVGVLHVFFGMAIAAYVAIKEKRYMDAVTGTFAWYMIFGGIGIYAAFSEKLISDIGLYIALLGAALIILFKASGERNPFKRIGSGLLGLYGIVNYASDILSYSRILALGLSGSVVASVMNIFATMGGPTIIGILIMLIVVPLATALNLAINVLGSFIHAARLQYIEFFGKFYIEGGRHFEPERIETKYSNVINVIKEENQ